MKLAIFIKNKSLAGDSRIATLTGMLLSSGHSIYDLSDGGPVQGDTDIILSVGGDGTFLSAAEIAAPSGVPVAGVNLGRMGFLSENRLDDVPAILAGDFILEDRAMLSARMEGEQPSDGNGHLALNEVCVHRCGAAMLGVDVRIDDQQLPTCWADGLLVATSSGSTAYSLSVGGPICTPDAEVLIIAPIAPHNLNIRPIVVPDNAKIRLSMHSRDDYARITMDNREWTVPTSTMLDIEVAQFSLKRMRRRKSNFISALNSKLFWGEDVRNL